MAKITSLSGFGYIKDIAGKPIAKCDLGVGEHDIKDDYEYVECTSRKERDDEFSVMTPPSSIIFPIWSDGVWVEDTVKKAAYDAERAKVAAKLNDIAANLPSWKEIADEYETLLVDAQTARDTADIKALATVVIKALRRSKKAERTLYWLAKNSAT